MEEPSEPIDALDLIGGALCLDFCNTASRRTAPDGPRERLHEPGDLARWAEYVGLLDGDAAARMLAEAKDRPPDAATALERARSLREAIYDTFSALADGRSPAAAGLATIEQTLAAAAPRRHLEPEDGRFEWTWALEGDPLAWVEGPVAASAVDLLRSGDLARVKECGADHCNWLFVDGSRNRSRRWCDMRECGNRAKARRHYARHRDS